MKKVLLVAMVLMSAFVMTSCGEDDKNELDDIREQFEIIKSRTTEKEETKEKSAVPKGDERRPGESVEDWLKRLRWKLRNDILGNNR